MRLACASLICLDLQSTHFANYEIESKTENTIGMEVSIDTLQQALKSGLKANFVQWKLSKVGSQAYLKVEMQVCAFTNLNVLSCQLMLRWCRRSRA